MSFTNWAVVVNFVCWQRVWPESKLVFERFISLEKWVAPSLYLISFFFAVRYYQIWILYKNQPLKMAILPRMILRNNASTTWAQLWWWNLVNSIVEFEIWMCPKIVKYVPAIPKWFWLMFENVHEWSFDYVCFLKDLGLYWQNHFQ